MYPPARCINKSVLATANVALTSTITCRMLGQSALTRRAYRLSAIATVIA
jgi:hypothetical protein